MLYVTNHAAVRLFERVYGQTYPWTYLPAPLRREASVKIKTPLLLSGVEALKKVSNEGVFPNGTYPFIKGHRAVVVDGVVVTVI